MVMYTIVPEQYWMANDESHVPTVDVQVAGRIINVTPIGEGMGKIVRLINCSLDDYLNPALSPGSIIHYVVTQQE